MAKILLLVLGLLAVYWILKIYRRRLDRAGPRAPAAGGENMVRCGHCGLHLPRSESITTEDSFYCSAEHQRAGQAEHRLQ